VRKLRDPVLNVADRAHASERWEDAAESLAVHVGMTVGDAGNDRTAVEIDDACPRTRMGSHRFIRADSDDAVSGNCNCRRDREPGIKGDDLAAFENNVGHWHGGLARHNRSLSCGRRC
jgi:hypothetical protein